MDGSVSVDWALAVAIGVSVWIIGGKIAAWWLNRLKESLEKQREEYANLFTANHPESLYKHYTLLGLLPGANRYEIIEAHRKLIRKEHPDRGGDTAKAAKLNDAKKILLKHLDK